MFFKGLTRNVSCFLQVTISIKGNSMMRAGCQLPECLIKLALMLKVSSFTTSFGASFVRLSGCEQPALIMLNVYSDLFKARNKSLMNINGHAGGPCNS